MKKKTVLPFLPLALLLVGLLIFLIGFPKSTAAEKDIYNKLTQEEYAAVFASMYPITNYNMEEFATYRGLSTFRCDTAFSDSRKLSKALKAAFSSANTIDTFYIGIDPIALWNACGHNKTRLEAALSDQIFLYMDQNPDTVFEFLLAAPALDYWVSLSEKDFKQYIQAYRTTCELLCAKENTFVFFAGAESWLIQNPANYQGDLLTLNEASSHKMLLLNFCDRFFQMSPQLLELKTEQLSDLVAAEKQAPFVSPDLSNYYFAFIGDSVMAYDTGSCSIPGVVAGLSGATVVNLSQGGTPACLTTDVPLYLSRMTSALSQEDILEFQNFDTFYNGLSTYRDHSANGVLNGKTLCFVLYLGLNDYFSGNALYAANGVMDDTTYEGALTKNIQFLRATYPEAKILLMTPNYCDAFRGGTERLSDKGGVLEDYAEVVIRVAKENDCDCLDIFHNSVINSNTTLAYLADGVHPNEAGRFEIGKQLVTYWNH